MAPELIRSGKARLKPKENDYDERTLRPSQLKSCLISAHNLDLQSAALDSEGDRFSSEENLISKIKQDLEYTSRILETNQIEVDQFNVQVDAYNTRIRNHRYAIEIYNHKVRAHSKNVQEFKQDCADRRFFVFDFDAMKQDLPFSITEYIQK